MHVSLKRDKHLNNFGYYLLKGYHFFPTVPKNEGSVIKKRFTIIMTLYQNVEVKSDAFSLVFTDIFRNI